MDTDDASAVTPPERDDEDELGTRFWLTGAAILLGIGVILCIGLLLFWRALYAWGFFGAFIALAALLLLFGWIYDRRHPRRNL